MTTNKWIKYENEITAHYYKQVKTWIENPNRKPSTTAFTQGLGRVMARLCEDYAETISVGFTCDEEDNETLAQPSVEDFHAGNIYLCDKCHILFLIVPDMKGLFHRTTSYPNSTYTTEINRPKAVCPKCEQESYKNIRIEND